jgi:hypothetical protein
VRSVLYISFLIVIVIEVSNVCIDIRIPVHDLVMGSRRPITVPILVGHRAILQRQVSFQLYRGAAWKMWKWSLLLDGSEGSV